MTWQRSNSSDFFDFLLSDDFQMSESKHFSPNLPQSPPFHQNLAISRQIHPETTPNSCNLSISRYISPYLTYIWSKSPPNYPKVAETRRNSSPHPLNPGQLWCGHPILDRGGGTHLPMTLPPQLATAARTAVATLCTPSTPGQLRRGHPVLDRGGGPSGSR